MYRWGVFALLCALLVVSAKADTCDRFDIRHHAETLFAITSGDGTVWIPGDLELGAIATNQILMGDYVFGVHSVFGEPQLGLRKRRVDADTGKYHVPRAIRGFAHNGTTVIYDHEFRDVTEFTLYELRDFMREVLADELALEGHNDPFNLAARYNAAGEWCGDKSPLADCVPTREDMFDIVSTEESRIVMADWEAMWERDPQAGDEGYEGFVTSLDFAVTPDGEDVYRSSPSGVYHGEAGFRLADEEVDEVFWLKATSDLEFEITPGVTIFLYGWCGGQVLDFELTDGVLTGGMIVVGPHPATDASDVVMMVNGDFDLEVRSPGPALRFTPGRNTRVYVTNEQDDVPLTVSWGSVVTPHDQAGTQFSQDIIEQGNSWVYEFTIPESGSGIYSDAWGEFEGPIIVNSGSMDWDREYVLFTSDGDRLNGNTYPGTAQRLSGWFRDTMRIKNSRVDPATGDTIVTIIDEPRQPHEGSDDDAHWPIVKDDCPAHGGPISGRWGTGCTENGVHVHKGHNIAATSWKPGQFVEIEGHRDSASASINGQHYVVKETLDSFRIKNIGGEGSSGGEGGFVHIWRLHKSDPEHPELQNNGVSGGYLRFNYDENIAVRLYNGDSQEHNIHIHGHRFMVVAENGESVGSTRFETAYSIAAGNTADLMVWAGNPNRVGSWIVANDLQYLSHVPAHTIWPDAVLTSSGPTTHVDYTGFAQGSLVLDAEGMAVPFSWLPPACSVEQDTIEVTRDSLGWAFENGGDIWVWLSGSGEFPTLPSGDAAGEITGYSWSVLERPSSQDPTIFTPDEASTYIADLEDGTYVFALTVWGHNSAEEDDEKYVQCRAEITVNVCSNGCGTHNDLDTIPHSWASPALTNLRLGLEVASDLSLNMKKRQMVDGEDIPPCSGEDGEDVICYSGSGNWMNMQPSPLGHASFELYPAGRLDQPDTITVEEFYGKNVINPTGPWDPQDPNPFSPLQTGRNFQFHRWSNIGPNTDFWLDIDPTDPTVDDISDWTFAIKQVVYDASVQTMGYILGTDLGVDSEPLPVHYVLYPLWQGSSNYGPRHHDVYFLILESSDEEFCEEFGCVHAPALGLIPPSTDHLNPVTLEREGGLSHVNENIRRRVNSGTFANERATSFVFTVDPDTLPVTDMASPSRYSPMKYVTWVNDMGETKHVVANMPFIYWGEVNVQSPNFSSGDVLDEGKMLIIDVGGCDDEIRGIGYRPRSGAFASPNGGWNASAEVFEPAGPPGCTDQASPLRMRGGQLLEFPDFENMYVIMKVHRAAFDGEVIPYFSITDTSDFAEAQYLGVPWTPALNNLGSAANVEYVSTYRNFGNGMAGPGLHGNQESVIGALPGDDDFSPLWQITNLFWNCGTFPLSLVDLTGVTLEDYADVRDDENYIMHDIAGRPQDIFLKSLNAAYGGDAFDSLTTDFYQLIGNMKTTKCPGYIKSKTSSTTGMITEEDIDQAIEDGVLFETANPAGSFLASSGQSLSILNAHVSLIFHPDAERDEEDLVLPPTTGFTFLDHPQRDSIVLPGVWFLIYKNETGDINLVAWRPMVNVDEPYMQGDYGLQGDFPPPEYLNDTASPFPQWTNCPSCAWEMLPYDDSLSRFYYDETDALFDDRRLHPFRLSSSPVQYEENDLINFVLLECDDEEFANVFNTRYVARLADYPSELTSTEVFWNEPQPDSNGNYADDDVEEALRSFVFGQVPSIHYWATNWDYSSLKTFTFQNHLVTCNMPFVAWGAEDDEHLVVDEGDCTQNIRHDPYGNPFIFFDNGPPSCEEQSHPLQRAWGGQVLGWERNEWVTMKIHRAVNRPTNEWYYYALFDSSEGVMAGYFGVPVAPLTQHLEEDDYWTNAIDSLKIVANGVPCERCSQYNFQDPIIGNDYSPLHAVTNLLWNCNNALTSGDLFNKSSSTGVLCGEDEKCDPYPIRVDLKWLECAQWVENNNGGSDMIYFNDDVALLAAGKLFATRSPVGNPLTSRIEVVNAPVVLVVDFNDVPSDDGEEVMMDWSDARLAFFLATDNTQRWLYTWIEGDALTWYMDAMAEWEMMMVAHSADGEWSQWELDMMEEVKWDMIMTIVEWDVEWDELTPASRAAFNDDTLAHVHVQAGDWVSFWSVSDSVPHGLVLSDDGEWKHAWDAVDFFLDDIMADMEWEETTESRFEDLYGHPGWATPMPVYGGHLLTASVKDTAVGTRLYFSDLVWGTYAMNGALEVVGANEN